MNNQPPPTTSINVMFATDGRVRAHAAIVLPYLVPLAVGDTISLGNEFATVGSLHFAPHRHCLSIYCTWDYDPTEAETLADALEDAAAEGWTIERV